MLEIKQSQLMRRSQVTFRADGPLETDATEEALRQEIKKLHLDRKFESLNIVSMCDTTF